MRVPVKGRIAGSRAAAAVSSVTPPSPRGSRARFPSARRTRPGGAQAPPRHAIEVQIVQLPRLHRRPSAAATASWCAARAPTPARAMPSSSVCSCDASSCGLPALLPSGKSLNRKRGTAACSTMSLAQPISTVGMPLASRWRATRLHVWWQTGQFGTRIAASARPRARGAGFPEHRSRSVTRWLRLVGAPWKCCATAPMRPAAAARRRARQREPCAAVLGAGVHPVVADMRDAQVVVAATCRRSRPGRTSRHRYTPRRAPGRPCPADRARRW